MQIIRPIICAALAGMWAAEAAAKSPESPELAAMPAQLEVRFALSALPPALRGNATVYVLDTESGYRLERKGTSGIECLVQRTAWELADFRDDIYIPLCYDRAGAQTYLRVIKDSARLRAGGMQSASLKAKIEERYADRTYRAPDKPGLSYMLSPMFRTVGPPDLKVRTMAMPHVMFYAPGVTNGDIGAAPDLADPSTLLHPFIDRQGNAEQSYIIQLLGPFEAARLVDDEAPLLKDLCAYRAILCLAERPDGGSDEEGTMARDVRHRH